MNPRRVLGYARVSSEEQARGSSLQDQQDAIAKYAAGAGLKVTRFYVEAESAIQEKIERREQIRSLMADVREGDLIVCDKLDRWSRDPEFTYGSIRQILERRASFYAVGDRCDPSTRDGDTMLGVRVLVAREEHKRIKERMVGTRRLLRDRGYYTEGQPPLGYRRAHPRGYKGAEKNVLVVQEKEAKTVRQVFRLCIAGHPLSVIAKQTGMSRCRAAIVLAARTYIGEIKDSRGTWIKARHPPIIDAATFHQARASLEGRRLGGPRPREAPSETSGWILRDIVACGHCGARMYSAYAGPKDARRYYYKCSRGCLTKTTRGTHVVFVPVRAVEDEAGALVVARLEELREELSRPPKRAPKPVGQDFAARRERLQRKRQRYLDAYGDELMTREELRAAMAKLDAESLRLDAQEQATTRPSPLADPRTRRAALREVGTIRRAWARATPVARREIVRQLATAVAVGNGPPRFTWRTAEELAEPADPHPVGRTG